MVVNYRGKFFYDIGPWSHRLAGRLAAIPLRIIRSWQSVAVAMLEVEDTLNQDFADVNDEETAAENLIKKIILSKGGNCNIDFCNIRHQKVRNFEISNLFCKSLKDFIKILLK
jgi:hypothetical protein